MRWERRQTQDAGVEGATTSFFNAVKAGTRVGTEKTTAGHLPETEAFESKGGAADLWNTTWLYSDINGSTFGVDIAFDDADFSSTTVAVDSVQMRVTYEPAEVEPAGAPTKRSLTGVGG